jgi:hypothetical protein
MGVILHRCGRNVKNIYTGTIYIRVKNYEFLAMASESPEHVMFRGRDVIEIALGACIMAFPTATTEEV